MAGDLGLSATGSWFSLRRLWVDIRRMFRLSTHRLERAIAAPRGGDWQSTTVMRLLRRLELR
jgi:hypothetical protein